MRREKGHWLQEERTWQEVGYRADWVRVQGAGGGMLRGWRERGCFLSRLLVLCHFPAAQVLGSLLPRCEELPVFSVQAREWSDEGESLTYSFMNKCQQLVMDEARPTGTPATRKPVPEVPSLPDLAC